MNVESIGNKVTSAKHYNLEAISLQCPRSDISHNYVKLTKG